MGQIMNHVDFSKFTENLSSNYLIHCITKDVCSVHLIVDFVYNVIIFRISPWLVSYCVLCLPSMDVV